MRNFLINNNKHLFNNLIVQRNFIVPKNVAGSRKGLCSLVYPNVGNCNYNMFTRRILNITFYNVLESLQILLLLC